MREAYGGTWLTGLVITFTFVFAAFLALSISYSKAFRVKNEVLSMVEKSNGATKNGITLISNYLYNNNYKLSGTCDGYSYGVTIKKPGSEPTITAINSAKANKRYNFCFSKIKSVAPNFPKRAFYEVKLFFKFNLPVIGEIGTFSVKGQSKDVVYPLDKSINYKSTTNIE